MEYNKVIYLKERASGKTRQIISMIKNDLAKDYNKIFLLTGNINVYNNIIFNKNVHLIKNTRDLIGVLIDPGKIIIIEDLFLFSEQKFKDIYNNVIMTINPKNVIVVSSLQTDPIINFRQKKMLEYMKKINGFTIIDSEKIEIKEITPWGIM